MSDYYREDVLRCDEAHKYEVHIGVRDRVMTGDSGDLYTNGLQAAATLAQLVDAPFLQGVADGCQQMLSERFRRVPAPAPGYVPATIRMTSINVEEE